MEGSGSVKHTAPIGAPGRMFPLLATTDWSLIGRMELKVEHIGLPSRDPVVLKDWYVAVLGADLVFDNGQTPPAFFVRLAGGLMLEIYEGDFAVKETADNKLNGFRHLALRIASIESAKAELESRGVRFSEQVKPAGGGGRVLFFNDCDGNLLHLVERPAGTVFG